MDIRERQNASFDYTFEAAERLRLRKIDGSLDSCQYVLDSVFGFASKYRQMLVAPLSLRNVSGDF